MDVAEIIRHAQRRAAEAGSSDVTMEHLNPEQVEQLAEVTLEWLRSRPCKPSPELDGWTQVAASQAAVLPMWSAQDNIDEVTRKSLRPLRAEIYDLLDDRGQIRKPPGQGSAIQVSPKYVSPPLPGTRSAGKVTSETLGAWLLKADPEVWDIARWIDEGRARIDDWSVQRNYRSLMMERGQRVFLWVSGQGRKLEPGIWGIGWVTGPCDWDVAGDDYWLDADVATNVGFFARVDIILLKEPVTRAVIRADARFERLEVLRQPFGSNPSFLTQAEAAALSEYVDVVPAPLEPGTERITVTESGAGFGDPTKNRVVELAAMAAVTKHLEEGKWQCQDVSHANCGWDITARRGSERRHVEVKGVSGTRPIILFTRNEHEKAQSDPVWSLMVVTQALNMPTVQDYEAAAAIGAAEPYVYRIELSGGTVHD